MRPAMVIVLLAAVAASQPPPARIVSPEVHADRRVTFRFRAPNAKEVLVAREGAQRVAMTKGNDGVWTLTTDPLEPDYYAYTFIADGVSLLDPMNAVIRPNLLNPQSVLHVSGFRPEAATSERSAADRRLELALGTDAPAFS